MTVAYIAASGLFILSLAGLSNQETSGKGNLYGIAGMLIAFVATALGSHGTNYGVLVSVLLPGVFIGASLSSRVAMTEMP